MVLLQNKDSISKSMRASESFRVTYSTATMNGACEEIRLDENGIPGTPGFRCGKRVCGFPEAMHVDSCALGIIACLPIFPDLSSLDENGRLKFE